MKKLLAIVLLLACVTLSFAACGKEKAPDGMQNVSDAEADFNLYVPSGWVKNTVGGVTGAYVSSADASNVTVTVYLPDQLYTPATYWEEFCLPQYENGTLTDFGVAEEACGETTLGGMDAVRKVFFYKLGDVSYESMQVIAVYRSRVYTLTYTAKGADYASHLEDVDKIVAEFTFR